MRTETRTVPKLEFVPVPDAATAPCLVPLPPVDESGYLRHRDLPAYTAAVLGALEQCNQQLELIDQLQPDEKAHPEMDAPVDMTGVPVKPTADFSQQPMVVEVNTYATMKEMQAAFTKVTRNAFPLTTPFLKAVTLSTVADGVRYCRLFVVMPKVYEDEEWGSWGHELGHCVFESWHPDVNWK